LPDGISEWPHRKTIIYNQIIETYNTKFLDIDQARSIKIGPPLTPSMSSQSTSSRFDLKLPKEYGAVHSNQPTEASR